MKEKGEHKVKLSDFEKNLKRLEEIVDKLEKGEMSLEESLKLFEEGIKLARTCEKALTEAERRIQILIQNDQGEIEPAPFDVFDEGEQESTVNSKSGETTSLKQNSSDANTSASRRKIADTENNNQEIEGDLPF